MKFADPKNDVAFKKIFGDENHPQILINFLNDTLSLEGKHRIESLEYLDKEQLPDIKELKNSIVDVRVRDKNKKEYIVEMQVESQDFFIKRTLYYIAKTYTKQLPIGGKYIELKPIIFIGIMNFNIFKSKNYLSRHQIVNLENKLQEMKEFEFVFLELQKFNKNEKELKTSTDKWAYFLKNAGFEKDIPSDINPPLKEAYEIAAMYKWNEKELLRYEKSEMDRMDEDARHSFALREAMEKGMEKGMVKAVKNLMNSQDISKEEAKKMLGIN